VNKTVLVVDDSISMRKMVCLTLERAGYATIEGADGQDALTRIAGKRVDLVVTDLNMPVMDGLTFIKTLRARPEFRLTPILMLTTEAHESKKQAGRAAGATGWIVKPFNPPQLLATIAKVLP
jgi:two-component system chemotaxis response regulator CheY